MVRGESGVGLSGWYESRVKGVLVSVKVEVVTDGMEG